MSSSHLYQSVIVGAGAYGTALALNCHQAGHQTTLIARHAAQATRLNQDRCNAAYLPECQFPESLVVTHTFSALKHADLVLIVTPAQVTRELLTNLAPILPASIPVALCAKGIEKDTYLLQAEIARHIIDNPLLVLSGPSFAQELATYQPTALMCASEDRAYAEEVSRRLRHATLRCYASDDPIGVQLGGALKNIIAIASGIVKASGFGLNTLAALLSRGLAEMTRLGVAMGAKAETFMGLAGMGDLILSGLSEQSRNFRFGYALVQNQEKSPILSESAVPGVVEGVATTDATVALAHKYGVRMPITSGVHALLNNEKTIEEVMGFLLNHQSNWE